jgi:anaerobic selenocysteine-containing dehydrogenase
MPVEVPLLEHPARHSFSLRVTGLIPNAPALEMNPDDAQRLGLRPHQRVDIQSRRGQVQGVELRITQMTAPGQLFMPFHFFETNANQVTQDAFDPISREPNYKQCAVRVATANLRGEK